MTEGEFKQVLGDYFDLADMVIKEKKDKNLMRRSLRDCGEKLKGFKFKFEEGNGVGGWQDFFSVRWKSLPHDIEFEVDNVGNGSCFLRGWGYGILNKADDSYGNGAIAVRLQDLYKYFKNKPQPMSIDSKTYRRIRAHTEALKAEFRQLSGGYKMIKQLDEIYDILKIYQGISKEVM